MSQAAIGCGVPFLSTFLNQYLAHLPPFRWFDLTNMVIARSDPARERRHLAQSSSVSVIVPARNKAGNIEDIMRRVPELGDGTELVFVEGHSTDNTAEAIKNMMAHYPHRKCQFYEQSGKGKGDAVRLGFEAAQGVILMITVFVKDSKGSCSPGSGIGPCLQWLCWKE